MNISKIAGGFTSSIGKFDKVAHQVKGLLCLALTLAAFLNPANLLSALASIAANAASSILDAVNGMIQAHINMLLGRVLGPLMMLQNYAARIVGLLNGFSSILAGLDQKINATLSFTFNTQDCANQAAQLMNCIQKQIEKKITKKILPKLNSALFKIQREIADDITKAGGLLEQQVGRRVRTAEKLMDQLNFMR